MTKCCFISFEGGEGCGKSTQARMLAESLSARGLGVLLTREPGGTPGAERIRNLLLDKDSPDWGPRAESLLFAAGRADHVANAILPALERGDWVLCDRFIDSTRAYQGGEGRLTDDDIMALHAIGSGGLLPDRTVLLVADPDEVARRLAARDGDDSDRIGGRDAAYHRRVVDRFEAIAAQESGRFLRVDAGGTPEQVHARVMQAISPLLETGR